MIVNKFINSDNNIHLSSTLQDIIGKVYQKDLNEIELGKHDIEGYKSNEAFFVVMEYKTAPQSPVGPEFHQQYLDVQFITKGEEKCGWAIMSDAERQSFADKYNYDSERDICFIDEKALSLRYFNMLPDEYYIFSPNTLHMPNLSVDEPCEVRKVVIKINICLLE